MPLHIKFRIKQNVQVAYGLVNECHFSH